MKKASLGIVVAIKTAIILAFLYLIFRSFPDKCTKTIVHTDKVDLNMEVVSTKVEEKEGIIESAKKTLLGVTDYRLEVIVKNNDIESGNCKVNIIFEDAPPMTTESQRIISGQNVAFFIDLPNKDVKIKEVKLLPDKKTITWTETIEYDCTLAEKYFGEQNSLFSIVNLAR